MKKMWKNLRRATLWGILLWIFIFVEISILMFLPGLKDSYMGQRIVHLLVFALLVLFVTKWYFKTVQASTKEGFVVGIWFIIVGTVLDAIITIPLFVKSYSFFYSDMYLWLGFLILIVVSTLVGHKLAGCKLCKMPKKMVGVKMPKAAAKFAKRAVTKLSPKPVKKAAAKPKKKAKKKAAKKNVKKAAAKKATKKKPAKKKAKKKK